MIERELSKKLIELSKKFPAVVVSGPRQSGKTTLVKDVFPHKPYILLEDPDHRAYAQEDPRGFLAQFPNGAVLDEVQRVPLLFSYLQGILDENDIPGLFILTGSQNYLMMEKVTQSLAGRVAILNLMPFSCDELSSGGITFEIYEEYIYNGFYPRKHDRDIKSVDFYSNYVRTYIERDVRQLKNVQDLGQFHKFLKMCAYRNGQLLNLSSLADDCGITHNTASAWISVLETAYIVFLLRPHYKNFNKRLVKTPKLYFHDAGLVAFLCDIESIDHVSNHANKGQLFETFIINELLKKRYNSGLNSNLYFWRDKSGKEIDIIVEKAGTLYPVEIKSGQTVSTDFFKNIHSWNDLSNGNPENSFIVYGGTTQQRRNNIYVLPWNDMNHLKKILL